MEYRSFTVRSKVCVSPQSAWDDWADKYALVAREFAPHSRFVWRMTPQLVTDRRVDSMETECRVIARLVECIGEGELPDMTRRWDDEIGVFGFPILVPDRVA